MTESASAERRRRTRVFYRGDIEVLVNDHPLKIKHSRDISLRGLFGETGYQVPLGTPCQVVIRLAGEDEELTLRIEAVVARVTQEGLGIEFTGMDPETYQHLRNIVLYNSPDPDRVEAEFRRPGIK